MSEEIVVAEVVVNKYCQSCKRYSKKTKKCLKSDRFIARKKTCESYEGKNA
jgi:hypothetical protein